MNDRENVDDGRYQPSGSVPPTWRLVVARELTDLWLGGKAPVLLLMFSVLLGLETFVMASNSELSLIPPKEMVYETLKTAIAVGLFIGLIIGADSLSGDRERGTLEALLLTPTSRRQIVIGKFLAAISPWPVALVLAVPYLWVLSQGDAVFGEAVISGAVLGTVMAAAYTGLGMLVSLWSNTNKTSYFVSLAIYVLFLVPSQLPGTAQQGAMGQLLQWINPMAATSHFLSKTLVNHRTLGEFYVWLTVPVLFAVVLLGLLFSYFGPSLRLEAGRRSRFGSYLGRMVGASMIACLLAYLSASSAAAQQAAAQQKAADMALRVGIDVEHKIVKAGDTFPFKTIVTNAGEKASPPLIVAMNVINLDGDGNPVDPEDWSPQRTQAIRSLTAGRSVDLSWQINAILDGNYMVYMVVIPEPTGADATSHPVSSPGIHLTVEPFTRLNPGGVLPFAVAGPLVMLGSVFLLYRLRRRKIDTGAPGDSQTPN